MAIYKNLVQLTILSNKKDGYNEVKCDSSLYPSKSSISSLSKIMQIKGTNFTGAVTYC